MSDEPYEVARWYRTTKYAKVMGRFLDGTKIPGGPYSMTQGVVGAFALFLVLQTAALWSQGNILIDIPLGVAMVWAPAKLAGYIRVGNRNPALLLIGLYRATTTPSQGRYNNEPYQAKTPHRVRGRVITDIPGAASRPAELARPRSVAKPSKSTPPGQPVETPRALSAVERLLAQSNSNR